MKHEEILRVKGGIINPTHTFINLHFSLLISAATPADLPFSDNSYLHFVTFV